MKIKKILLSSITASIIITASYAEDTTLDTVDVWETEINSSSLNIVGSAIETKQADHLSDLLRSLPGVDVGGTNSINNRINIRGLQDENLDITLDGAKVQNANMFHHIGNLLINPDLLKKVEINVGTNSVVNGSLGGSVSFQTKDGEDLLENADKFGGRVQATYNSNNSQSLSAAGFGKVGENGDFLIYHNQVNKNNWQDGRGVENFGVEGETSNTLIKYGHKLNENNKIIVSYDKLKDEGDYIPRPDFSTEYNEYATGDAVFPTEYTRETITLKHELRLDNTSVDTTIYSNENELERYESWVGRSPRPDLEGTLNGSVKTIGLNTKAQTNITTGSILNTITYGGLYDKQNSKVTWNSDKYGENEEAITKAIYVENAMDFDNGLVLTPGIRYNMYDFDGSYGEITDREFTYSLAGEYALTESLTLLANATTLYKGVEMVDVLASNRTTMANTEDLKSETGINKEIGFKYQDNNILGADSAGFMFKYFDTTINDYIGTDWISGVGYMKNDGDLNLKGFEASFAYNKGNFNSLLTYAKTTTEYKNTGFVNDKDPGDSISLSLNYDILPNVAVSWESLFMLTEEDLAESTSSAITYNVKDSYNVHDIAVNWKPKSVNNLTVILGIDNIFDKAYVAHTSENRVIKNISSADYEPGRNVKVTLAYKF